METPTWYDIYRIFNNTDASDYEIDAKLQGQSEEVENENK